MGSCRKDKNKILIFLEKDELEYMLDKNYKLQQLTIRIDDKTTLEIYKNF